jgi:hypothetical protein
MGWNKKTARLKLGGKNFIFQGLSTDGSVLGIGCGFSDLDFFSVFSGSGFGSFRWIFGLFFGFQRLRILVFLRVDSVGSSDLDLFCC